MRFLTKLILIALGSFLAQMIFPWWTAALCAFIVSALLPDTGFKSFLSGFLGVGLLWLFAAIYYSVRTDFILTQKVAELMQLGSSGILIIITALVGALVAGIASLSGSLFRKLVKERRKSSRYSPSNY